MEPFIALSGIIVDARDLRIPKARALALALDRNLIEYGSLVECRTVDGLEVVAFDAEVEVPQLRIHPIKEVERIAVIFNEADSSYPEVLALRSDFPEVPHLNLRKTTFPRSLCLYDEAYDELKTRWTPQRFIMRIRDWLSLTSQGILHQEDQPLEPLLLGYSGFVVLPHDLFSSMEQLQAPFYLFARQLKSGELFCIAQREKTKSGLTSLSATASIHLCRPQAHGIIRQQPNSLSDLSDFVSTGGIDLIAELKARLRQWKAESSEGAGVLESHLVVILLLPKLRRQTADSPEDMEIRAFFCSDTIKQVGEKLGVWSLFEGKIGAIIGPEKPAQADLIGVDLFNSSFQLSRELAATLNGYPGPVDLAISAIGVGALGSHVVTNLFRSGFGDWTIIDNDKLMPHNLGRHALNDHLLGCEKSVAMNAFLNSIVRGTGKVKNIPANVMNSGGYNEEVKGALENSEIILDMSASVAAARFLSLSAESRARRVSLFMNSSGQDLVLLAESQDRKSRLDQLEMQYYRAIASNDALSGHFQPLEGRRRYGQSCRDVASTLPQDMVALHSAIGSRAVREVSSVPEARITLWRVDPQCNVNRIEIPTAPTIQFERGEWRVCTDEFLLKKLSRYRAEKLPRETGGVLLGSFDMERKIVYIADTLPSPPDSEEWPTLYIRGARGLRPLVDSIFKKTDGMLEYIGEWHSHPVSCPPIPSTDDLKVFAWLTSLMEKEGLPALMMIVADEGYGCFLGQINREPLLVLPQ